MFSGIIADVGVISRIEKREGGLRLFIQSQTLDMEDVQTGDSIAVQGVCLTAVKIDGKTFEVDVSRETLDCTTGLEITGTHVNLEKALRLSDRLGGHLVAGHVDGVGEVVELANLGESWKLRVSVPQPLAKYIASKGSIAINGVSLTVNQVEGVVFNINLIPHTLAATALGELRTGAKVNLEIDLIARYVERMMQPKVTDK